MLSTAVAGCCRLQMICAAETSTFFSKKKIEKTKQNMGVLTLRFCQKCQSEIIR